MESESAVITAALAPAAALIISIATFVLTQRRAQMTEERSAARDTVEILATQNKALVAEIASLRARVVKLEKHVTDCEKERALLLTQLVTQAVKPVEKAQ